MNTTTYNLPIMRTSRRAAHIHQPMHFNFINYHSHTSFQSVQLVEGKNTFELTGQNLSSGLTKSDYQVTFKSVFQSLDCTVLELSNFQLNCTFNAEANKLFDGKTEEVSATVFVSYQFCCNYCNSISVKPVPN